MSQPVAGSSNKEKNNHLEGRSGSGTMKKMGPAVKGSPLAGNKTMSGGINRATRKA